MNMNKVVQRLLRIPDPVTYQTAAYDESEASAGLSLEEVEAIEALDASESVDESDDVPESETIVEEESLAPLQREAERLVITHVFRDSTGTPEPSSLLAVVEARDTRNEPADFDGKVSLMVMQGDPESPQRIKRWDFTEEETSAAWQTSNLGDGLHLELPLEVAQLPTGPCELWVRLEAADGRKFLRRSPSRQLRSPAWKKLAMAGLLTTIPEPVNRKKSKKSRLSPWIPRIRSILCVPVESRKSP